MTDEPKLPRRWNRPAYGVDSDLKYILERKREMRDKEARRRRYEPGFRVDPPASRKQEASTPMIRFTFSYDPSEPDPNDLTGMSDSEYNRIIDGLTRLGAYDVEIINDEPGEKE